MMTKIVRDEDIYPRKDISQKTINSYVEALKAGADFPPLLVQKIQEDGETKTIILDGWHRKRAFEKLKKELEKENEKEDDGTKLEPQIEFWKDETLDKEEHLEELRIEASKRNLEHGIRLKDSDIEFQAERIVKARPVEELKGIESELAGEFGLTNGRISQMIGSLVRSRKASRNSIIFKLSKLGWTQEEIGEKVGLDRSTVAKNVKKFSTKEIHNAFKDGKSVEEIAEALGMSVSWVKKYDPVKHQDQDHSKGSRRNPFEDGFNPTIVALEQSSSELTCRVNFVSIPL